MLPFIAIPVVHSAGGWIASTAAGGYLAGTLSSTWAGAFIAGNATALAASATAAATGVAGYIAGSGAVALGLAPATFLGLTPVGWAIAGGSAAALAGGTGVAYWKSRRFRSAVDEVLDQINAERIKGGLEPFKTSWDLMKGLKREYRQEPRDYEGNFDFEEVR